MINILFVIAAIFAIKQIIKEAAEKPAPKDTRFDWDAYWKDVENGMPTTEQIKKRQNGGYYTTRPKE